MRNLNSLATAALLAVIAAAAIAADSPSVNAEVGGLEVVNKGATPAANDKPMQSSCMNRCTANEVKCGGDVRRAKRQCARDASVGGRDPMATETNDYAYFCGFFGNAPTVCGADHYTARCTARFHYRYGVCVDAMQDNIAAMRYDCFRAEREAQRMCREELRDCKATCGGG